MEGWSHHPPPMLKYHQTPLRMHIDMMHPPQQVPSPAAALQGVQQNIQSNTTTTVAFEDGKLKETDYSRKSTRWHREASARIRARKNDALTEEELLENSKMLVVRKKNKYVHRYRLMNMRQGPEQAEIRFETPL